MTPPIFDAIVVGGGLAGAGTARAIARRGRSVLLCESQPHLAAKASGNERGLLMPYVATDASPPGRLYARGFHFTRELLTGDPRTRPLYVECGALQLPATHRLARILSENRPLAEGVQIERLSALEASARAGILIPTDAFFIPEAGFCQPREITQALVSTSPHAITVRCLLEATTLHIDGDRWRVLFGNGESALAEIVVLCGAHEISKFEQTSKIPLEPIRGQTTLAHSSPSSAALKTVISHAGYITPCAGGVHFIGAHYRHNDMNEAPVEGDTTEILSRLHETLPGLSTLTPISSRVCFRASTYDRMPYIGEIPLGTKPALYINAGHGSRGLITAPMGGEIIARLIDREPLEDLADAAMITSAIRLAKRIGR